MDWHETEFRLLQERAVWGIRPGRRCFFFADKATAAIGGFHFLFVQRAPLHKRVYHILAAVTAYPICFAGCEYANVFGSIRIRKNVWGLCGCVRNLRFRAKHKTAARALQDFAGFP